MCLFKTLYFYTSRRHDKWSWLWNSISIMKLEHIFKRIKNIYATIRYYNFVLRYCYNLSSFCRKLQWFNFDNKISFDESEQYSNLISMIFVWLRISKCEKCLKRIIDVSKIFIYSNARNIKNFNSKVESLFETKYFNFCY